ncbi:MAG: helix-turn-helix transcriptional regulator [Clostridia bacterium]|nr:helix-turn-helix transcriptional regulator [Clostridia bacterium]
MDTNKIQDTTLNYFTEPLTYETRPWLSPAPHTHQELEIIYVVRGSCVAYANQRKEVLRPGDLFIAYPNQVHYYESAVWGVGSYVLLIFNASILYEMASQIEGHEPAENAVHIGIDTPLAKRLQEIAQIKGFYSDAKARYLIGLMMMDLLPKLKLSPIVPEEDTTVLMLLEYCRKHYREPLSLERLSKEFHLSRGYISQIFNRKINMSFTHFVNALRVHTAVKLLKNSDMKIVDIAEEVGYTSLRSFNRAFMEIANSTPTVYRRLYRKK